MSTGLKSVLIKKQTCRKNMDEEVKRAYEEILNKATKQCKMKKFNLYKNQEIVPHSYREQYLALQ